jgi:dolichol-phosphate mannosyltransferase
MEILNKTIIKIKTKKEFYLRYLVSSLVSGSMELGSFYLMNNFFAVNYILAAITSFVLSSITGYLMKRKLAFQNSYRPRRKQFIIFVLISMGGIVINTGTVILIVELFSAWPTFGKIAGMLTAFIYNYLMSRHITFKLMK